MPKFTKQHYEVVAITLKKWISEDRYNRASIKDELIKLFREDNSNFKPEKFRKACQ